MHSISSHHIVEVGFSHLCNKVVPKICAMVPKMGNVCRKCAAWRQNVRHGAKNVLHDSKNVLHGAKMCGMLIKMCSKVLKIFSMVPKLCGMVPKCAACY